jgi:MFS family permease
LAPLQTVSGARLQMRLSLRHREFRLLWAAHAASGMGDWAGRLALATLIYARTQSAATVALVVAVSLAAWFGPGQLLATAGDRFSRTAVLVVCDAVRCAAFTAMLLPVGSTGLLVLAAVAGLAAPPFAAARAALVPDTVPDADYPAAIALTQATDQVTIVAGYAAGGLLIAAVGPRACLALNALSFAVSAALVSRMSGAYGSRRARIPRRLAAAVKAIHADRQIVLALLLTAITGACAMAAEALVVPLAREGGGGTGTSALFAIAVPVGTLVATLLLKRATDARTNLRHASALGIVGGAGGAACFTLGNQTPMFVLGLLSAGVVFGVAAPTNAVIGPRLPTEVRASAFAILLGALLGSQAAGAALGGVVAQSLGVPPTCALFLATALAASLMCRWHLRQPSRRYTPASRPLRMRLPRAAPRLAPSGQASGPTREAS